MSERAEELARRFEAAIEQFIAFVGEVPDEHWYTTTGGEGWAVAAVAHHIARSSGPEAEMIDAVARAQPIEDAFISWSVLHTLNADGANTHAACTKAEVLDLMRTNHAHALALVRGLSDAQLDSAAVVPIVDDAPVTAGQLIEWVLIGHIEGHMASIVASIGT